MRLLIPTALRLFARSVKIPVRKYSVILVALLCVAWGHIQIASSADDEGLTRGLGSGVDVIFIPAMMAASVEVEGRTDPEPTATRIPTVIPTDEPTATPVSTPSPSEALQFRGTSDQGQPLLIEAKPDLSAITKFEVDAQIICGTHSGSVEIRLADQLGYTVTNNRFLIRSISPGGNTNVFMGTIRENGTQMEGDWSIWLDGTDLFRSCSNKGSWTATVSPLAQ